jgi:hypothetical protein
MWTVGVVVVCALLSVAAVFALKCYGLGLVFASSPRNPVIEQVAEAQAAPEHMVELYKYKRHVHKEPRGIQPSEKHKGSSPAVVKGGNGKGKIGTGNGGGVELGGGNIGNGGLWAGAWGDFSDSEKNLMRLNDASLVAQNESVPIGQVCAFPAGAL